jgi:alkylhydroperoxidase/carboxymuconolactone decarboxylase family protein YurZ
MTDGQEILDQIAAAGRRVLPMHEYLAEHDPVGLSGYNGFLTATIYDKDALEPKHKEIILACACIGAGSAPPVIAAHISKALSHGATRAEVLQAIEMTAAVFATRAMGAGMVAMLEADGAGAA